MLIPIRDENPTRRFPIVTIALIAFNIAIFIYMFLVLPSRATFNEFVARFALFPGTITGQGISGNPIEPVFLTIITSMFLHGGLLHIAFNMLFLWIFGNNVEDVLGRVKFIIFYLLAGTAGAFAHIATDPGSTVPTLGASGAISGVLGAYLVLFPNARVLTVIPIIFFIEIIRVPAVILIGFWFILQLFSGLFELGLGTNGGGVAYFAHIGGFVAGVLLVLILPRKRYYRR
ncbi:MAG: rhomboid family intramembrane serine protease [Actinobacteria bacterium]|nr:rhomboid family intramembrane serine protease [Actinomycetota bacterium]